jgi:uncharacterized protein YkwD
MEQCRDDGRSSPVKSAEFRWTLPAVALALTPSLAHALDLNSFRAQHGKPALSYSPALAAVAQSQAYGMAGRGIVNVSVVVARVMSCRT